VEDEEEEEDEGEDEDQSIKMPKVIYLSVLVL
jgi:hypothetical protein